MDDKFRSFFSKHDNFTAAQAQKAGISRTSLSSFAKKGVVERVSRRLYRNPTTETNIPWDQEDLVVVVNSIPEGVVCLISALDIYQMTDEIPRSYWIAVSNDRQSPRRKGARIIRFRNMKLGRTKMKIGNKTIYIFDKERTVIDSFRYLSIEVAIKALKAYLKTNDTHQPDFQKLSKYSRILRKDITPYILALTT